MSILSKIKQLVNLNPKHVETNSTPLTYELEKQDFYVVGVDYCKSGIRAIRQANPLWRKGVKGLTEAGVINKRVYHYEYINKPVKLVPEPTNTYDTNAIMVQIAGEKVGYISMSDCPTVRQISQWDIKYVSAFFRGGEWKHVLPDGELISGEDTLRITIRIAFVRR